MVASFCDDRFGGLRLDVLAALTARFGQPRIKADLFDPSAIVFGQARDTNGMTSQTVFFVADFHSSFSVRFADGGAPNT